MSNNKELHVADDTNVVTKMTEETNELLPFKEIELTRRKKAKVSPEDYEHLNGYLWYASRTGNTYYAARTEERGGKKRVIYMHREIMGATEECVDHINGDTLNNCRSNLRKVTHRENLQNQKPQEGRSSKYKGVYWNEKDKCYVVQIKDRGRVRTIGGIESEETAARIYDLLAIDRFKEYARPNLHQPPIKETPELVERVARAIYEARNGAWDFYAYKADSRIAEAYQKDAKAAIKAINEVTHG